MSKLKSPMDFIRFLNDARADNNHYYQNGGCWELFRILRKQFPQANPYHTLLDIPQHVATEIDGILYDIRGVVKRPKLYYRMTTDSWPALDCGPHRWHKNYYLHHPKNEMRTTIKDKYIDSNGSLEDWDWEIRERLKPLIDEAYKMVKNSNWSETDAESFLLVSQFAKLKEDFDQWLFYTTDKYDSPI